MLNKIFTIFIFPPSDYVFVVALDFDLILGYYNHLEYTAKIFEKSYRLRGMHGNFSEERLSKIFVEELSVSVI